VYLVLFWTLTLRLSLPLYNHHFAEFTPWHDHFILGAYSAAERERVLASHHHAYEQPHHHHAAIAHASSDMARSQIYSGGIRVISAPDPLSSAISIATVLDSAVFIPFVALFLEPSRKLWRTFHASLPIPLGLECPPPHPPPRIVSNLLPS
jgi:hypothetical protein